MVSLYSNAAAASRSVTLNTLSIVTGPFADRRAERFCKGSLARKVRVPDWLLGFRNRPPHRTHQHLAHQGRNQYDAKPRARLGNHAWLKKD
jgi:hypothetical protein